MGGEKVMSGSSGARIVRLLGLGVLGAMLVFFAWNSDFGYAYRMHLRSTQQLSLDFSDLKVVSSAEVVKAFPIGMFCRSGQSELGDAFCATELADWNAIKALDTVFFFESDRLVFAKVDIPPWAHGDLMDYMRRQHGEPAGYTSRVQWAKVLLAGAGNVAAASVGVPPMFDMSPDELGVWRLPSGACLVVNMEADWPLQWSTAFWVSPGKPCLRQTTGFTS